MTVATHGEVVIRGLCNGQNITNILYFRMVSEDGDPTALAVDFAGGLQADFVPVWLATMSVHYSLVSLDIQLYDAQWNKLLFLPYPSIVGANGTVAGDLAGPAQVAIIKFSLDPTSALVPSDTAKPKRSYLAFGPIGEDNILDNGAFQGNTYTGGSLAALLFFLSEDHDFGGDIGVAHPERVGSPSSIGQRASMLVTTASFRGKASFRRSRNN